MARKSNEGREHLSRLLPYVFKQSCPGRSEEERDKAVTAGVAAVLQEYPGWPPEDDEELYRSLLSAVSAMRLAVCGES